MVKNIYLGDRDEPTKLSLLRNPGNEQRAKMKSGVDKMLPICKITTGMVIIRKKGHPGRCDSVLWASSCALKGFQFDSNQGI